MIAITIITSDVSSPARVRHRRAAPRTAAVATIPGPRRSPENECEMPALPVAPVIPAPRSPRR